MSCECGYLLHGRVLPHYDLVKRVAVCRDDLVHILGPHQIAYLTDRQTEIDRKRERKRECVLKRGERKSDRILDVDIYFLKMECVSRGMGRGARSR